MGASDCDCLDGRAKRGHQGNHSRLRGWGGGVATMSKGAYSRKGMPERECSSLPCVLNAR